VVQFEFPQARQALCQIDNLWDTGNMKNGDLVVARGHEGVFKLIDISKDGYTADVELFNVSKQQPMGYKMSAPTSTLFPFKEDASQAAARIVREATQDK
jgi:hypothetical protein